MSTLCLGGAHLAAGLWPSPVARASLPLKRQCYSQRTLCTLQTLAFGGHLCACVGQAESIPARFPCPHCSIASSILQNRTRQSHLQNRSWQNPCSCGYGVDSVEPCQAESGAVLTIPCNVDAATCITFKKVSQRHPDIFDPFCGRDVGSHFAD